MATAKFPKIHNLSNNNYFALYELISPILSPSSPIMSSFTAFGAVYSLQREIVQVMIEFWEILHDNCYATLRMYFFNKFQYW